MKTPHVMVVSLAPARQALTSFEERPLEHCFEVFLLEVKKTRIPSNWRIRYHLQNSLKLHNSIRSLKEIFERLPPTEK